MTRAIRAGIAGITAMVLVAGCGERPAEPTGAAPAATDEPAAPNAMQAGGDLAGFPVRPVSQAVKLTLDPDQPGYSGSVSIELAVSEETRTFGFHAREMTLVRTALARAEGAAVSVQTETGEHGLVTATTDGPMQPGRYRLEIDFERPYEDRAVGLYRVDQGGDAYLFTQFQAIDARRAFPCWDEPRYKIPFSMTIQAPAEDLVLFNTPVTEERTADGMTTHVFAQTPPVSTYFMAIAAGPFDSIPIEGLEVPGRIYAVRGQAHLAKLGAAMTPPLLEAMEAYFDRPYPYHKLDYVAVPDYWPGAMENAGLITYRDRLLLLNEQTASVAQRRTLATVIAHELAHMWFGDLVTLTWWDDLWLNESFASWMASKIVRELYPEFRMDLADVRYAEYAMVSDARPSTRAIRQPVKEPAQIMEDLGLAYTKGQSVLEMMEAWIGPDAFRRGVLDYIESHAWGNARAADLWQALGEASGEDVQGMLGGFLEQSGVPLVSFEPVGSTGLRVSQARFLNVGVEAETRRWSIPVTLRFGTREGEQTLSFLLSEAEQEINLGEGVEWVVPNAQASGYFRWELPRAELLALAGAATERMTPRERVAFLGNARGLLLAGRIDGAEYLEILARFGDDPDPDVVTAVLSGLDSVQAWFVPDDQREAYGAWVGRTLEPALARFGLEPAEGEPEAVALLRPSLIRALGVEAEIPEVRDHAGRLASAFMADPSVVDSSLAGAALDVTAWHGDLALHEGYRSGFENADSPVERGVYLGSLGTFPDPVIQRRALDYAISGAVRNTELPSVFASLPDTDAAAALRWRWLQENYDAVAKRLPEMFLPSLVGLAGGCSAGRLAEARTFFTSPEHHVEGVDAQLGKLEDRVSDCVRLREREGTAVETYLQRTE